MASLQYLQSQVMQMKKANPFRQDPWTWRPSVPWSIRSGKGIKAELIANV